MVYDYADYISEDTVKDIKAADYHRCCLILSSIVNEYEDRKDKKGKLWDRHWWEYRDQAIERMMRILGEDIELKGQKP